MSKNNQQFKDLLRDEVNLNPKRLERLETGVGAVNSYLKDHLTGYQKMERQGSYALGTLIKPVDDNDEYDADIQIVMNPNPNWRAKDYVTAIYNTLKQNHNYTDKLRLKTRCVTIDYAGDFHLDVVPRANLCAAGTTSAIGSRTDSSQQMGPGIGTGSARRIGLRAET